MNERLRHCLAPFDVSISTLHTHPVFVAIYSNPRVPRLNDTSGACSLTRPWPVACARVCVDFSPFLNVRFESHDRVVSLPNTALLWALAIA